MPIKRESLCRASVNLKPYFCVSVLTHCNVQTRDDFNVIKAILEFTLLARSSGCSDNNVLPLRVITISTAVRNMLMAVKYEVDA